MLAVAGCGNRGSGQQDPAKSNPPEKREVKTTGGTTTKRKADATREIAWVVHWDSSDLNFVTENDYNGHMNGVSGSIYEDGEPVGTFTADKAEAYKQSDRLTLTGHVTLKGHEAQKPNELETVMTCGQLEWDSASNVIRAKDDVNVVAPAYSIGPFAELWANPKLTHFGTPDVFKMKPEARSTKQ